MRQRFQTESGKRKQIKVISDLFHSLGRWPGRAGSKTESSVPSHTSGSHRWLVSTEHVRFPMKSVHADRHAKGLTGLSGSRVGLIP